MNYVSLCKRLAVCTALGIALSLPVGAVWNTMQPQLAYAEEYSSLRGNIIENAYLLVGTPFKMGGSFPSEGFDGSVMCSMFLVKVVSRCRELLMSNMM